MMSLQQSTMHCNTSRALSSRPHGMPCRSGRLAQGATLQPSTFGGTSVSVARRQTDRRRSAVAAQAAKDLKFYSWAVDGKDVACPLCESARLILNEKTLSYDKVGVDYGSKPKEVEGAGGTPVLEYVPDGKKYGGLTNMLDFLETKYPEPAIGKTGSGKSPSETKEADVDGLFEAFMKSQPNGDTKAVTAKLEELESNISKIGGPFFGQAVVDITDLILGPRLHHIEVQLSKQGAWPSSLPATEKYLGAIRNLPSWQAVKPTDADVSTFWEKHAGKC